MNSSPAAVYAQIPRNSGKLKLPFISAVVKSSRSPVSRKLSMFMLDSAGRVNSRSRRIPRIFDASSCYRKMDVPVPCM